MAAHSTTDEALVETRARASLEQCYQRPLSDAEWDYAKQALLALTTLLEHAQPTIPQRLALLAISPNTE